MRNSLLFFFFYINSSESNVVINYIQFNHPADTADTQKKALLCNSKDTSVLLMRRWPPQPCKNSDSHEFKSRMKEKSLWKAEGIWSEAALRRRAPMCAAELSHKPAFASGLSEAKPLERKRAIKHVWKRAVHSDFNQTAHFLLYCTSSIRLIEWSCLRSWLFL